MNLAMILMVQKIKIRILNKRMKRCRKMRNLMKGMIKLSLTWIM